MFKLFVLSVARLLGITFRTFFPPSGQGHLTLKRALIMLGFIPVFTLVQGIHWIGFFLDEIFFRGYRRVEIREPLFVLGVPRSGTTHLHRVLAEDERFTTFSTWECLFALSVTERRFWLGLGSLDRRIGRPLGRLLDWLETRIFSGMEDVHQMRLSDPEEDYFAFMPALACFILFLPFANAEFVWKMGTFDRDMPPEQRKLLMDYYQRCLQKHLYVHGTDKRLLSKNAAFAPLAGSLRERFPDARFILCLREPQKTLPSQLSSIESGIAAFDSMAAAPNLYDRLADQLGFYYRNLEQVFSEIPDQRCVWVTMSQLKENLTQAITAAYRQLGFDLTEQYRSQLARQQVQARNYRSSHRYTLAQFGLASEDIERELGPVYRTLVARVSPDTEATSGAQANGTRAEPATRPPNQEPALPC